MRVYPMHNIHPNLFLLSLSRRGRRAQREGPAVPRGRAETLSPRYPTCPSQPCDLDGRHAARAAPPSPAPPSGGPAPAPPTTRSHHCHSHGGPRQPCGPSPSDRHPSSGGHALSRSPVSTSGLSPQPCRQKRQLTFATAATPSLSRAHKSGSQRLASVQQQSETDAGAAAAVSGPHHPHSTPTAATRPPAPAGSTPTSASSGSGADKPAGQAQRSRRG